MSTIGVDLEQFIRDPYATGIQRVLQQLALHWPADIQAWWVLPAGDSSYTLLTPCQAANLLTLPFESNSGDELRHRVSQCAAALHADPEVPRVGMGQLISLFDAWLLPEVSYLPTVLERLDIFARSMPVTMIGYDALPMTDPQNYRFVPGRGGDVSEYFRRLATVDAVVCISEYSRLTILDRLRRDRAKRTTVAHPGGDHLEIRHASSAADRQRRPKFVRLGTMEARKRPVEILSAFVQAARSGIDAELVFIGNANASSSAVNAQVEQAIADGYPVAWIQGASDAEVYDIVHAAGAFLSIGTEGYGIPVLEAIRLGTPVLFDGIQPAGDLMEGRGAIRVPAMTEHDLVCLFKRFGAPGGLSDISAQVLPDQVPTWQSFTDGVVAEALRS